MNFFIYEQYMKHVTLYMEVHNENVIHICYTKYYKNELSSLCYKLSNTEGIF
jgi:hypothetical protein